MNTQLDGWTRYFMWLRLLGDEYYYANRNKKKKMRDQYAKVNPFFFLTPNEFNPTNDDRIEAELFMKQLPTKEKERNSKKMVTLEKERNSKKMGTLLADCTTSANTIYVCPGVPKTCVVTEQPNKKENNMGYEMNQDMNARQHLQNRLASKLTEKRYELRDKFHMNPMTVSSKAELADALKNGQVTVDESCDDSEVNYLGVRALKLVDKDRDEAGYKAAEKMLGDAFTKTRDVIIVLPTDKGLEALQQFEAATFN